MNDDIGNRQPQDSTNEQDEASAPEQGQPEPSVRVLAWSPDGTLLAVGGSDGARVVDVGSGEERLHLQPDAEVSALAWSPDGTLLAIACGDGRSAIFEVGSGDVRHRLEFPAGGADAAPPTGIEHGEAQLQDLQENIDRVRSQTGEQRQDDTEGTTGEAEGATADTEGETGDGKVKGGAPQDDTGAASESEAPPPA